MNIFLELFHNIALIVVMGVLYSLLYRKFALHPLRYQLISGVLFGLISVIGMTLPLHIHPGVIFDGRSIIISIAGFLVGPAAALIAAASAALYRVYLGGSGTTMGVSVSATSALIGILFYYLRRRNQAVVRLPWLVVFGVAVHVAMLVMTINLPADIRFRIFSSIAIPVITIYPIASVVVCLVLLGQEGQIKSDLELSKSENRYRGIVEHMTMMMCRFLPDAGRITFANGVFCTFFGVSGEELAGARFYDFVPRASRSAVISQIGALTAAEPVVSLEMSDSLGGDERWHRWTVLALFGDEGTIVECQAIGTDITRQKNDERQIRESLREKEVLLKEVHHRVKNNMQIISSLLNLQSAYIKDERDRELFVESQNRVRSMALVHEKLYGSGSFAEIYFDEYIRRLSEEICNSFPHDPGRIEMEVRAENLALGIDQAIPCALIVNELISNAMKYAFPEGRKGRITVRFHRDGDRKYVLSVSDDGVGLSDDAAADSRETLGLQLVRSLARQLGGTISIEKIGGFSYTIRF
ncbi:MAG: PAS domain-containing protein [Spirochaetes bacterium]|nr:PAS domain-containing protein [Spirochaetota bacterium]